MPLFPACRRLLAIVLLCAAGLAPAAQAADADDEAVGELMGELVFHADLLNSLDRLCPRGKKKKANWHAALPPLPPEATTPELLDLSRRLADDASRQLMQENGGCGSPAFDEVYAESRQTFGELIARWRKL